jgi:hypothetical protein
MQLLQQLERVCLARLDTPPPPAPASAAAAVAAAGGASSADGDVLGAALGRWQRLGQRARHPAQVWLSHEKKNRLSD